LLSKIILLFEEKVRCKIFRVESDCKSVFKFRVLNARLL